tara:strand:+ start:2731 stop:3174 length:444 start_codon:yes stop_codon:yes gene_type:complete
LKNFKIKPKEIDSSTCVIHIGQKIEDGKIVETGEPINLHENEWVKIFPIITIKESLALGTFRNSVEEGELSVAMDSICESLAKRVVDWNWTGIDGEPLAKPYKNPEVFKDLYNEEVLWLITATSGETKSDEKKESRPLQNTSLTQQG